MKFSKTLIAASLVLVSADSFAAAFQLGEQNASGLGRAYAGEAAVADDASVVARNPALMSLFKEKRISVAAIGVIPDVSLKGEAGAYGLDQSVLDDSSIAPTEVIPAAYFTMPINDKVSIGFGAFSNFGLSTEFNEDYAAGSIAGKTEIITVNMNASASYKVNEQFSVGLGLNYIYADAKVIRNAGANPVGLPSETETAHLEGDDHSFGWNVGLMYQVDDNNRFGFNYRSETDIDFDGDYSNGLPPELRGTSGVKLPGSLELTLPAVAEFSGSHQLAKRFGVHYSVLWTGWNSFEKLEAYTPSVQTPVFKKDESFSNSMRYSIGADYQVSDELLIRAGVAYDESPVDQTHLSISIPDTDRFWFSVGGNYAFSEHSNVDLGVSVLRGKTQNFTEEDSFAKALGQQVSWDFESKGNAVLIGAQYNYKF